MPPYFFFPLSITLTETPLYFAITLPLLYFFLSLSLSHFSHSSSPIYFCAHPLYSFPLSLFFSLSLSLSLYFSTLTGGGIGYRNNNGAKPGRACSNVVLKPETKRVRVGSCRVYKEPHDRNPRHSSSFRWRTRCHFRWRWSWLFFQT